jgi:hypothetical protein
MHKRGTGAPAAGAPLSDVPAASTRAATSVSAAFPDATGASSQLSTEAGPAAAMVSEATSALGRALVAATPGDQSHAALLRFCVASMHKEEIRGAAGAERRRQREQVKTYSSLLEEHMRRHDEGFVHLPASAGSPECWVVRRPVRAAPKKLCAATVVDTLRALSLEQLQRVTAETLSSAAENILRSSLSRQATGRFSVAVQMNRPRPTIEFSQRGLPVQPQSPLRKPETASQSHAPGAIAVCERVDSTAACPGYPLVGGGAEARRLAGALRDCRDEAKADAKSTRDRLQIHEAAAKLCEPVVEAYVQSVSPMASAAPVQVEVAGATTDFFVRARTVSHKKVVTLTKLLPMCLAAIKAALGAAHMVDAVTPRALAYLQSTVGLNDVFQRLQVDLDKEQAASTTTKRQVSLDRGALRPGRQGRGEAPPPCAPKADHQPPTGHPPATGDLAQSGAESVE